jgi:hypothetical protein
MRSAKAQVGGELDAPYPIDRCNSHAPEIEAAERPIPQRVACRLQRMAADFNAAGHEVV